MQTSVKYFSNLIAHRKITDTICILLAAASLFAFIHYALNNSWFVGQDFHHLILLQQRPFIPFLLTPIDIHFPLPLHRFFCWFFYKQLDMNFVAATLFLTALFVCSAIYLYKLLELIQPSRLNAILLTFYFANTYLLDLFLWWSSGLHRIPYILCAIACCYHSLRVHRIYSHMDAVLCFFYLIVAFGFFEKAIFIPAYAAALIFSDVILSRGRLTFRATAIVIGMGLIAAAYAGMLAITMHDKQLTTQMPMLFFTTLQMGVKKSLQTLIPVQNHTSIFSPSVPLFNYLHYSIFVFFIYAALKKNINAIVIGAILCALIYLNFLPAAVSNRAEQYSPFFVFLTRYHFENMFLFIIFFALIVKAFRIEYKAKNRFSELFICACFCVAIVNAFFAYRSALITAQNDYSKFGGHAEAIYVKELKKSFAQAEKTGAIVLDQPLPSVMYDASDDTFEPSFSNLASAWRVDTKFGDSSVADFRIDAHGKLQRTR